MSPFIWGKNWSWVQTARLVIMRQFSSTQKFLVDDAFVK